MLYRNHHFRPRQGIILLVVLALLTLFASIGVAFVYFSEAEVNKSAGQKTGETVKLPDADLLFNIVLKQLIYPTNNTSSAFITHSLLENMYGRPNANNVSNINAFNGTGRRPYLYRDPNAPVNDLQIAGFPTDPALVGQDELFRLNYQNRIYNELLHGSLNPTYTYPDHKNAYLGAVAANWTDRTGLQHGPVAIARSFAREIKFRVAVIDTTITDPLVSNVVRYHEVLFNPYSNDGSQTGYWSNTLPSSVASFVKPLSIVELPILSSPFQYQPNPVIQMDDVFGTNARIVMNPQTCQAHTLRPNPRLNPFFPPPADLGGDVKNLPPEVKTLVGFNGTTPVFANNDSYWMDFGFPAIPWSNNRKVKPLAAVFIMDNDGKVNLNVAGNLRGRDLATVPSPATGHVSAHGLGPYEINLLKMYPASVPMATRIQELRNLIAGAQVGSSFERGRAGITPVAPNPNAGDPTTSTTGYWPLVQGAPPYSLFNLDGSNDGTGATANWLGSFPWQLPGELGLPRTFLRWPFYANVTGYNSGLANEFNRSPVDPNNTYSPLFISPFAPPQVTAKLPLSGNEFSVGGISHQRRFGFHNQESLYRVNDTGTDKIDGEIRKLMPSAFHSLTLPFKGAEQRWQMTTISNDLNVMGIPPWHNGQDSAPQFQYLVNRAQTLPPPLDVLYPLDTNPSRGAGLPRQLPGGPQATGEYANVANYLWRSVFGNQNRIDLSRQLPDYPLPANNNIQLDLTDNIVRSRYMVALQARQKMAFELYSLLANLTHPSNVDTQRWLVQLAVNIVDYVDNDDYPTWLMIPGTSPTDVGSIVWGTELPRLVINEVYAEAVNNPIDIPAMQAQNDYDVRHWVELYNPLMNAGYAGVWPDGANARLNVNGTSVYRLIITTHINSANAGNNNVNNIRNSNNNLGNPDSLTAAHTNIIQFPADATVEPSDDNYGTGAPSTIPVPNRGFYLIGMPPGSEPNGTTPPTLPNEEAAFPTNNFDSPQMEITGRIPRSNTRFDDANRQAILLQRLANPYLLHNPMPGEPGHDPALPYNPYITVDYVRNIRVAHAVQYNESGTSDNDLITQRHSIGKMQPYASVNEPAGGAPPQPSESLWVDQIPDADKSRAGRNAYTSQIQHTFLRHNGVEAPFPLTTAPLNEPTNQPNQAANGLAYCNTLKLPFDWLKHLDRAPTSPVDLLQISGYKPHELTQQFNRLSNVNTATAFPGTLTAGNVVNFTMTDPLIGQLHGSPYSIENDYYVEITYDINDGMTTTSTPEWVLAAGVNLSVSLNQFSAVTSLTTLPGHTVTAARVRQIVPHAHFAPWYRAGQSVDVQSSNRLYRLLEGVAVRNPGVHVGQYRFTSGTEPVSPANTNNISAPINPAGGDFSRWVQLDNGVRLTDGDTLPNHSATQIISTNDALISMVGSGNPLADPTRVAFNNFISANVGDTLVMNAGQANEERVMVLEIDYQNNRIRTVINNLPAAMTTPPPGTNGTFPITLDFAYVAGRQPGRINLNTMWDLETFRALADAQLMNAFIGPVGNEDVNVDLVFRKLFQQRQPQYFSGNRMVGTTGINNPPFIVIPEDRPLQGMATGDIALNREVPLQGIGNTALSDRFRRDGEVPGDDTDPHRFTRTLFEVGAPGLAHPARRFELLSKIWNNTTVRSNTFSVWITIGFFEYDEATNSIGAELGQLQGKNVRHRFFAVVDRSSIDSWLRSWAIHAPSGGSTPPASINLFMNSSLFPTLDPRHETYPILSQTVPSVTALSQQGDYGRIGGTFVNLPGNASFLPGIWRVQLTGPNPFFDASGQYSSIGQLVQVQSNVGAEVAQIVADPSGAAAVPNVIFMKLSIDHTNAGPLTIRPLPVPPTVLHWSQLK